MRSMRLATACRSAFVGLCIAAGCSPQAETAPAQPDATATATPASKPPAAASQAVDATPTSEPPKPATAELPENMPVPPNANVDTVVNTAGMQLVMARLPEAESHEAVIMFYQEKLPQLGWTVGSVTPIQTGDPSLPFENAARTGIVKVYETKTSKGYSVQIETRPK